MPRVLELLAAAELEGEQMMRPRREGQPHEGHARVLAAGEGTVPAVPNARTARSAGACQCQRRIIGRGIGG